MYLSSFFYQHSAITTKLFTLARFSYYLLQGPFDLGLFAYKAMSEQAGGHKSNTRMAPFEQSHGELCSHKTQPARNHDLHNAPSRECVTAHPVRPLTNSA